MPVIINTPFFPAGLPPAPSGTPSSLLIHSDTTQGSTIFTDSSLNNFTITAEQDAIHSTIESKFGGSSMYFDGIGDELTIPNDAEFNVGSGDFTIDFWVNMNNVATSTQGMFSTHDTDRQGVHMVFNQFGPPTMQLFLGHGAGWGNGIPGVKSDFVSGTWYHIAITRSVNTVKTFIDGVIDINVAYSNTLSSPTTPFKVGQSHETAWNLGGYIDEFRAIKGVAEWTANFTPPVAAYLV